MNFENTKQEILNYEIDTEEKDDVFIIRLMKNIYHQLETESIPLEEYMKIMCYKNEKIAEVLKEKSDPNSFLFAILVLGRKIPARFLASKFNCDFWSLWEKVKPYETESIYAECDNEYISKVRKPEEEITSKEFLHTADEDRLYYWIPDGDIEISDEIRNWFAEIQRELKNISGSIEKKESVIPFMRHMMKTLDTMNQNFEPLFAFSSMFYEFIDHCNETIYQASIQLLDQMLKRKIKVCLDYRKTCEDDWQYSFFICEQCKEIKRYLAVLANPELRNRYLWADCI